MSFQCSLVDQGNAGGGTAQLSTGPAQRSGPPLSRRRSRNSNSSVVDLDARTFDNIFIICSIQDDYVFSIISSHKQFL